MKLLFVILFNLALIVGTCVGQQTFDSTTLRINVLVGKSNNNTITDAEKGELRMYIFKIQNKGFMLDEHQADYNGALVEIDKALLLWSAIGDTLSMANLKKYKGYLYGKLLQFSKGKQELNTAISLFSAKQFESGVAVSYHDFSLLYEMEKKLDSALFYENAALKYWQSQNDTFRIIVSNNQLIHIYTKQNNLDHAIEIQTITENMIHKFNLHWNPLINFYYVSYLLCKKKKNSKLSNHYKKLYGSKIDELKKDNINAKSMYE